MADSPDPGPPSQPVANQPPKPPRSPVPPKMQALMMALGDPSVSRIYANGFTLGISNADTHIVWQMFGRPVAMVNMSYTLAKTLSLELSALVKDWEDKTKQNLQTTADIDKAFGRSK